MKPIVHQFNTSLDSQSGYSLKVTNIHEVDLNVSCSLYVYCVFVVFAEVIKHLALMEDSMKEQDEEKEDIENRLKQTEQQLKNSEKIKEELNRKVNRSHLLCSILPIFISLRVSISCIELNVCSPSPIYCIIHDNFMVI